MWIFLPLQVPLSLTGYPEEFTLHYITVDQVIQLVSQFGPGALMAKFDVEAAYAMFQFILGIAICLV